MTTPHLPRDAGTAPVRPSPVTVTRVTPVDARAVLVSFGARAVPGVEDVALDAAPADDDPTPGAAGSPAADAAGTVRRLVDLGGGPTPVTVRVTTDGVSATADAPPAATGALLDRWLGLGDDLAAAHAHLGRDRRLAPLLRSRPHLRVLGHPDGFEAAVQAVLTQQVTLAAGRTCGGRLATAYGTPGPDGLLAYPAPDALAAVDPVALQAVLRVPHARARAVHALATACADGLVLAPGADLAQVRARLLALPGIGPWTADVVALRALGDRDAFPGGDLVLRRVLDLPDPKAVAAVAGPWSPYRAVAATHLWAAAGYAD
ncbi:DNA-3-methyladenine glycosylase [Cellulomonas sp. SLBN-39]|uniref:DNA-3-methyladenine glycosylase family protein n=1 Tax=Cellulomonas sp. SLBN-39 TaxID=2768446 RepID=UPI0011525D7C|nr:DNA-3-methyladenine glycosylase 2 [Cellulomonas sp. SLBN-39]TQL03606.1 DNA-3-methyladenine glycosylase II [Cellulomonas sp. SLBN-39]